MNTIQRFILSIVQGITELLPVSSSAHLILAGKAINFDISTNTTLLAILHIGTTLAIILFFRKELFKDLFTKYKLFFYFKLLLATLPTAVIGFLFEDYIANFLRGNIIMAVSLIVVGILFILAENIKLPSSEVSPEDVPLGKMMVVGTGQILSLIPGVSRSGVTILTGMSVGLDKYSAFNLSFILGIPLLIGANLYLVAKGLLLANGASLENVSLPLIETLLIVAITFTIGYVALILVKRFKRSKWLTTFGIYRILIGILILILSI
ncbi:MAG: undecaprenyl-diphosphate phosphatase [Candidatus Dojkabacteria bacterium]